jgi:hypothetical protein
VCVKDVLISETGSVFFLKNTKPADMQVNVLLEELKQTGTGSVTDDTMVKFLRSCVCIHLKLPVLMFFLFRSI